MTVPTTTHASNGSEQKPLCFPRPKLHGRAFYESIGSPKLVLAPMVEASEFVRQPSASPRLHLRFR